MTSLLPVPLPEFTDGIPLGAQDMNRLSVNEMYLSGKAGLWSVAVPFFSFPGTKNVYHVHQYLVLILDPSQEAFNRTFTLTVNGVLVQTYNYVVDENPAQFTEIVDLEALGTPPTYYTSYEAVVARTAGSVGTIAAVSIFEHPTSGGATSLPYSLPTFVTTATAVQLNALADNLAYMLGLADSGVNAGYNSLPQFMALQVGYEYKNLYFRIRHVHDWLYYKIYIDAGYYDSEVQISLTYNGNVILNAWSQGPLGSDNTNRFNTLEGWVDVSAYGLTIGNYYTLYLYGELVQGPMDWYRVLAPVLLAEVPSENVL